MEAEVPNQIHGIIWQFSRSLWKVASRRAGCFCHVCCFLGVRGRGDLQCMPLEGFLFACCQWWREHLFLGWAAGAFPRLFEVIHTKGRQQACLWVTPRTSYPALGAREDPTFLWFWFYSFLLFPFVLFINYQFTTLFYQACSISCLTLNKTSVFQNQLFFVCT